MPESRMTTRRNAQRRRNATRRSSRIRRRARLAELESTQLRVRVPDYGDTMQFLYVWGNNDFNQTLGCGDFQTPIHKRVPYISSSNGDFGMRDAALGDGHTLLWMQNERLDAGGCDDYGQIGCRFGGCVLEERALVKGIYFPIRGSDVLHIECTAAASYVVSRSGDVYGWGHILTTAGNYPASDPRNVGERFVLVYEAHGGNPVCKISTGAHHVVALLQDGKVLTWGNPDMGQLGRMHDAVVPKREFYSGAMEPTVVGLLSGDVVVDAFCGAWSTYLRTADGRILVCGLNWAGQLGIYPDDIRYDATTHSDLEVCAVHEDELFDYRKRMLHKIMIATPTESEALTKLGLVKIAAGRDHALGLTAEGKVYSWGRSAYGALGRGDLESTMDCRQCFPLPEPVSGLDTTRVVEIAAAEGVSGAIDEEGKVYAWGRNTYHRTGIPAEEDACFFVPKEVTLHTDAFTPIFDTQPFRMKMGYTHSAVLSRAVDEEGKPVKIATPKRGPLVDYWTLFYGEGSKR